jgi:hypothetical protein
MQGTQQNRLDMYASVALWIKTQVCTGVEMQQQDLGPGKATRMICAIFVSDGKNHAARKRKKKHILVPELSALADEHMARYRCA